ncbi:TPA: SAM-dependent DNA methyltransferase, partial [Klebsiella variicola]|nr:SAM-dependent DNA methyltransferase [Klebsiella variicola]
YRKRDEKDKYSSLASLQDIRDNDYNLNIQRYVDTFKEEEEIDLKAVLIEREQLKSQLDDLEAKMAVYIRELGYDA